MAVNHRSELHEVIHLAPRHGARAGDNFWELFPLTRGGAIVFALTPLMSGAGLWLYDLRRLGLGGLSKAFAHGRATATAIVSSALREFAAVAAPADLRTLRTVIMGGERSGPSDLERAWRVFPSSCAFLYTYGSTEAPTSAWSLIERDASAASAAPELALHPFPDTSITILDQDGHPAAVGEVGEIIVRSHYLSSGYWNRPEWERGGFPDGLRRRSDLSDRRFRPDRRPPTAARRRAGDGRVKVRGQRVELGAVEEAMIALDCVRTGAVAAVERDGGTALTAFVVPARAGTKPSEVRAALAAVFPSGAVPSSIFVVDQLPSLPNGKLDRRAIAAAAPPINRAPRSRLGLPTSSSVRYSAFGKSSSTIALWSYR